MRRFKRWNNIANEIIDLEIAKSKTQDVKLRKKLDKKISDLETVKQVLLNDAVSEIPIKERTLNYLYDDYEETKESI